MGHSLWQCRPHEGLRHPFTPDQPCSPNDAYAALVAAAGYVPVALTGEDYIELMPADWRTIGDGGIQVDYRTYNCAELGPYRHQLSGLAGKGTRWEIHADPYDVSRIWVRNHHAKDGGWITVPWTHHAMVAQPFADFTWRHARAILAARGADDTSEAAIAAAVENLLERAGKGPDRRVIARTRAAASMPLRPAVPGRPAGGEDEEPVEDAVAQVIPFGVFDAFTDGSR